MSKVLPMITRNLLGAALVLLAFPLLMGGGAEISGMIGPPSLAWAITLTLGAQIALFAAGSVSTPSKGKMGVSRAVAVTIFLIGSLAAPVFLYAWIYEKLTHIELLDPSQLVWSLVGSLTGLTLLLISAKAWHLSLRRSESN